MGTQLQAARIARGWSQRRLLQALNDAAKARHLAIAEPASLKVMISRWENGRALPDDLYRRLLKGIYELSDELLGFPAAANETQSRGAVVNLAVHGALLVPTRVDPGIVQHFRVLLTEYCRVDSLTGPRYVVGSMQSQLGALEQLCGAARGDVRDSLLHIGTRFAELAGWLYQDGGDLAAAMYWNNRAMDYAQELGEAQLISYVLMRKSNVATDGGHIGQGLGLATASLRPWNELTPGLRALALRQKAYAHALANEVDDCARALDEARSQVRRVAIDLPEPAFTSYCTPQYVEMEAANSLARLGRAAEAAKIYSDSLDEWPSAERRDHGLCLSRLALAYAEMGEVEQACFIGKQAADVVCAAPSARTLDVLRRVSGQVAPSRRIDAVVELRHALAGIV